MDEHSRSGRSDASIRAAHAECASACHASSITRSVGRSSSRCSTSGGLLALFAGGNPYARERFGHGFCHPGAATRGAPRTPAAPRPALRYGAPREDARMADKTQQKNLDNEVPLEKKLDDLYKLIDGMEVAQFTTRRADGHLVSRPMQVQRRVSGSDLWFMTNGESHKLEELATDPHVNCAFYNGRTREWVSVSGTAVISRDKRLIHDLYQADWRAWLGDEGGGRDGGPDDPRITLVLIEAHSVIYSKKDRPAPLQLFELAKGIVTGEPPKMSDTRTLGEGELQRAQAVTGDRASADL